MFCASEFSITTKNLLSTRRILSCGILETPRFGRKSNFLFTPGSSVAFECNEGFVLIGDPRRTCTAEGQWDPPVYGYTTCLRKYKLQSIETKKCVRVICLSGTACPSASFCTLFLSLHSHTYKHSQWISNAEDCFLSQARSSIRVVLLGSQ